MSIRLIRDQARRNTAQAKQEAYLQAEVRRLTDELATERRRADAAENDLRICMEEPCGVCKYLQNRGDQFPCSVKSEWCGGSHWEWRGVEGAGEDG